MVVNARSSGKFSNTVMGKVGPGRPLPAKVGEARNASHFEDPLRANQVSHSQKDLRFTAVIVESIQPTGQRGLRATGIWKCRNWAESDK